MRSLIITLLILTTFDISAFTQEREIYPDYIDIGDIPIIGTIEFKDAETDSTKRVIWYDQEGRILKEQFTNYQPVNGKYIIDGTYLYKYGKGQFPQDRFYMNDKEDTLLVKFFYNGKSKLRKRVRWEFERKSKLRKGAPDYYDGSPYGCIPAEEDIIRYREWTKKQIKKYQYKNGVVVKAKTTNDPNNGSRTWLLEYNHDNNLVERREYGYKMRSNNWIEMYSYEVDKTIKEKKYLVTYWDVIPPTEMQQIIFQNNKFARIINTKTGN